jgi:hypothetical protein
MSGGTPTAPTDISGKASVVLTNKGDVATFDTARTRLAVGINGKALIADSTVSKGIAWKDTAGLVANTFTGNQDIGGNNVDNIQNLIHDISTTTTTLDFSGDQLQTISISANTTFTTSNRATGKSKTIKITTDGTERTLTFPSWKFVGSKPTSQVASKIGILTVTSFGTADTDITASYAVEE